MHLKKLTLTNFKNYEQVELELSEKVNCFTGRNGEGKTNLLDAVYYLSFCKSFFNSIDSQNVKHDENFFILKGEYQRRDKQETISCGVEAGKKKKFRRNKKDYDRLADHIGLLPLVMVSPQDSLLITEGSDMRRKFMDSVISQYDREYLSQLITYHRLLQQRNAQLKRFAETNTFDAILMATWDDQLSETGEYIYKVRKEFVEGFIPQFQKYYSAVAGGREEVGLEYFSQLHTGKSMKDILTEHLPQDRQVRYSTAGIHKDDLQFKIGDHSVKKFASQGQQKTYLLALKLAQFDFIKDIKKTTPILLLDDIFDKLDDERVQALMGMMKDEAFGQVYITDTNKERMEEVLNTAGIDFKLFEIEGGAIKI